MSTSTPIMVWNGDLAVLDEQAEHRMCQEFGPDFDFSTTAPGKKHHKDFLRVRKAVFHDMVVKYSEE